MKHRAVSWDDVDRDARRLSRVLGPKGRWRGIVAVARGGLVPAAMLAHALEIDAHDMVRIASYAAPAHRSDPRLLKGPQWAGDGAGWLVVDDLADSGATAQLIRRLLPAGHLAVFYAKPAGQPFVDTYLRAIEPEVWLDFPWEKDPEEV